MPTVEYERNAEVIRRGLSRAFPDSYVVTEPGYANRVWVKIISPTFNGLDEERKRVLVWDAAKSELGEGAASIAQIIPYGTDEL